MISKGSIKLGDDPASQDRARRIRIYAKAVRSGQLIPYGKTGDDDGLVTCHRCGVVIDMARDPNEEVLLVHRTKAGWVCAPCTESLLNFKDAKTGKRSMAMFHQERLGCPAEIRRKICGGDRQGGNIEEDGSGSCGFGDEI